MTEVANRVLTKLGAQRVVALDRTGGAAAALILDNLDAIRRDELARYRWRFAQTRAEVAASASAPAWGWDRAFDAPGDCLRLTQVGDDPDGTPDHEVEGLRILTDADSPLRFKYLRDRPDPSSWHPCFVEVFACRMALELCDRIKQSSADKGTLRQDYMLAVTTARRVDAIEGPPERISSQGVPWLEAHH